LPKRSEEPLQRCCRAACHAGNVAAIANGNEELLDGDRMEGVPALLT
jgi:hypothetical protein